jgi:GTP cyclohydrolase II
MYPELVTRPDMSVFLPPIGNHDGLSVGDVAKLGNPETSFPAGVHDECNGSDVFGSDICTCRPYLVHGIEEAARDAQKGGVGLIVYNRKEGRALGEVTKFLVYNARKRQEGGDQAATYFERTECVAGVQDARFQQLMPDVLHWLGIRRIDRFMSMSNMKHDAMIEAGIDIVERVPIPADLVPPDARRDGGEEGRRVFHPRHAANPRRPLEGRRPQDRGFLSVLSVGDRAGIAARRPFDARPHPYPPLLAPLEGEGDYDAKPRRFSAVPGPAAEVWRYAVVPLSSRSEGRVRVGRVSVGQFNDLPLAKPACCPSEPR